MIADDHRLVLDGIKRALESDGGFEIVGETQSGTQVLPLVGKTNPDLVLLDVRMPHMDGLACLDQLRSRHPAVKVVMLSASSNPELVEAALRRGAAAYVIKTVNPDDLPGDATPGARRERPYGDRRRGDASARAQRPSASPSAS